MHTMKIHIDTVTDRMSFRDIIANQDTIGKAIRKTAAGQERKEAAVLVNKVCHKITEEK